MAMAGGQDEAIADGNDVAGHRGRMRAQFRRSDGAALSDLDLLESLLFVIPRRDVRPVARAGVPSRAHRVDASGGLELGLQRRRPA